MPLDVAAGTLRRLQALRDQCLLRIVDAADPDAARAVLARLGRISAEQAAYQVNFVSEVIGTPHGPMVLMDAKDLTDRQLRRVVDGLVRTADELGLESGTLEVPPAGRMLAELQSVRVAAVGSVLPPPDPISRTPPDVLPEAWCGVAASWLRQAAFEPLRVEVVGVEAEIGWDSLEEYLHHSVTDGFRVSAGSVATGIRTVVGRGRVNTRLAFMAAGLSWSIAELARQASDIRDHVRLCADEAAYAYVTPVAATRRSPVSAFGSGVPHDVPDWPEGRPGEGDGLLGHLSDVMALDAFWYQVLGPGHLARTGPIAEARPLRHGKVELTLGAVEDWLEEERGLTTPRAPGSAQAAREPSALRQRGRAILAACFLSGQEARTLRRQPRNSSA
ncbi:MAG TPA: hypothetical protein VFY84_14910 [Jiangellales bacterium]|nr:hypothetical protein [Jiangellales bacterium]